MSVFPIHSEFLESHSIPHPCTPSPCVTKSHTHTEVFSKNTG